MDFKTSMSLSHEQIISVIGREIPTTINNQERWIKLPDDLTSNEIEKIEKFLYPNTGVIEQMNYEEIIDFILKNNGIIPEKSILKNKSLFMKKMLEENKKFIEVMIKNKELYEEIIKTEKLTRSENIIDDKGLIKFLSDNKRLLESFKKERAKKLIEKIKNFLSKIRR